MIAKRVPDRPDDSVDLIVSLLVRHPELSRVVIRPRFTSIAFFFIARGEADDDHAGLRAAVLEHLAGFHALARTTQPRTSVRVRTAEGLTFVEIVRAGKDIARDEIALLVAVVRQHFGDRLVVHPPADEADDDESGEREAALETALDAVRRAKQRKSLVGLREERRVLIYFGR